MADDSTAPLLGSATTTNSPDTSPYPNKHDHKLRSSSFSLTSESTPLLRREETPEISYGTENDERSSTPVPQDAGDYEDSGKRRRRRWPVAIAVSTLITAVILTLVFGFAAPSAVKIYAQEAAAFAPEKISLDSATAEGLSMRIRGEFTLDGSRVTGGLVRHVGRFATWVAKEVETGEAEVDVYLPEYDNVLLGRAFLPAVKLNIRDGHSNYIDVMVNLKSGDVNGIRQIADDWMSGRLAQLRVQGTAKVDIRSGILNFGNQMVVVDKFISGQELPHLPSFSIAKLNVHENPLNPQDPGIAIEVAISVSNEYALSLVIPSLGFDILVPNCIPTDPYILVADATTGTVDVRPAEPAVVNVSGFVRDLPPELTTKCPGKKDSPLDLIISDYLKSHQTVIYVRGAEPPSSSTPRWMVDLLKSVTVPVPVTGHDFGQLIKNFTMSDVHFSLPDPFAEPDTPDAQASVSALVKVLVNLPEEMNFDVDIPRVRANVDVYYHDAKFGVLDLSKWQPSNATRINDTDSSPLLLVTFEIKDGPLLVTDNDVFSDVVQSILFGNKPVQLDLQALVDGDLKTTLGQFTVHDIPAQGSINVKPSIGSSIGGMIKPKVNSLEILHTTPSTISIQATINFTNPTPYSATIPYIDCLLLYNGTALAHVTGRSLSIVPGDNVGVLFEALWSPLASGGDIGVAAGRELLSNYISGFNTTVTLQAHEGSIPGLPDIGRALSGIQLDVAVPKLGAPDDDDDGDNDDGEDDKPHFIKEATLHVFSSTAVFTLISPLSHSTMYIDSIDATALYNHTEPIGRIEYESPFAVPPGLSQTPKLPVTLELNGVGYDAVRKALGGTLLMDAKAKVGVTLGEYSTKIFYQGKGIGAKVRI